MSAPPPLHNSPESAGPAAPGGPPPPSYGGAPPGDQPPPPARKSNTVWWALGGGLLGLLALCSCAGMVGIGVLGGGVFAAFQATAGPRDATTAYFEAVADRDYTTARNALSAAQRASITPQVLEGTWRVREAVNGRVEAFDITDTDIASTNGKTSATVTGTLRYTGGASEARTITLVEEGDDWKIASIP